MSLYLINQLYARKKNMAFYINAMINAIIRHSNECKFKLMLSK